MMTASKALTAAAIGSAICISCLATANAADVNLRYAHFMPQASWQHEKLFQAWADAVQEDSGGRVKVTVFPAETLGKAQAGYDNAKNGIADIAWTVQGYTANRFPLSQLMELPNLFESGAVGSCAFQKLYDSGALDAEYKETKVLFVHTHGPGHLHTKGKAVTTLDEIKGLKIRRPTEVIGQLLTELGAEPIGMPAPATYEAMQRGAIDGYMLPWESVKSFRTHEVSDQHTDFGFYSLAFVVTMNKAKYEALPADLKKVIDDNSGMKWALVAGRGYDEGDKAGIATIHETGGSIHQVSAQERPTWEAAAARASKAYLDKLDAMGLPGTATYEKVKGYVAECRSTL